MHKRQGEKKIERKRERDISFDTFNGVFYESKVNMLRALTMSVMNMRFYL